MEMMTIGDLCMGHPPNTPPYSYHWSEINGRYRVYEEENWQCVGEYKTEVTLLRDYPSAINDGTSIINQPRETRLNYRYH